MEIKFRDLRADEIEVKPQTVKANGFSLLLYKDARCDMHLLDETVGAMNWQRKHSRDNANCIVSIYDSEKKMWIEKEDTGTESFTEQEKGLASDSFKRACFNWGIGRELYTSPFIYISNASYIKALDNGKFAINGKFKVGYIEIENKVITALQIEDSKGNVVFTYGKTPKKATSVNKAENAKAVEKNNQDEGKAFLESREGMIEQLVEYVKDENMEKLLAHYKKDCLQDMTDDELRDACKKVFKKK